MRPIISAALAAVVLLTGCGTSPSVRKQADPTPAATVLREPELKKSLLTPEDVGTGFVSETYGWSTGTNGFPSCLAVLDGITHFSVPTRELSVGIHADTDVGFPLVYSSAAAFSTEREAGTALPALREKLGGCTEVQQTEVDGVVSRFRVSHDDKRLVEKVDDQANVYVVGSVRDGSREVPLSFGISVVQVGSNVVLTGFMSSRSGSVVTEMTAVARRAVARIVAVAAGRSIPEAPPLGFEPSAGDTGPGTAT